MKNLYTAEVRVTSGRDGHARSSDGHLDQRLGWPKELGGDGSAANPEQLFAAGYAACFASSLKSAAASLKASFELEAVDASSTLSVRDDGSYTVSAVSLRIYARTGAETQAAVLAEAQRICAYSNATRGQVALTVAFA